MNKKYEEIYKIVEKELSCSAHGMDHVIRVCNLCKRLAKCEDDVNEEVLMLSALLHDIARAREDSDTTRKTRHEILGSEMAEKILISQGYPENVVCGVKHCIKTHRYRGNNAPETIEAKILFDADKLDSIGAMGIARSYILAGEFSERIYVDVPLEEYLQENIMENGRIRDFSKHAPNIEYEIKLKKVPERLHTAKAKEMAVERLKFMEKFFEVLKDEIM